MTTPLLRLGVDLGGTKIEAIVLEPGTHGFRQVARRRIPTEQQLGYDHIVASCASLVRAIADEADISLDRIPVGVGMPGAIRRDGAVKNSNTTCLNGKPFRRDLSSALGLEARFDNDANCFALAETHFGAASSHRDGVVFGVIMGTGVGGGVVMNGRVWSGAMGIGGEWGHHTVYALPPNHDADLRPCYCGKRGCVEVYVSGPALEQDYERRSGTRRSAAEVFARRGNDPHADAATTILLDAFARGIANVIDVLDPSAIVLGGGLSNVRCLYDEGVERIARLVFNDELTTPVLAPALGDSAGVIGAALLGFERST